MATTTNTKENTGYVFENKGKWYARITYRDASGNRRNVKRTAADKKKQRQFSETYARNYLRKVNRSLIKRKFRLFTLQIITNKHI